MSFPSSLAQGRYKLAAPLGQGGMATVFRAFDQRLHVWRAIKVLSPEFAAKPKLVGRFVAEAQTMASLEHRHLVRVYDVGQDRQFAYIVMELVEGGTLVDWIERNGPMPARLAAEVLLQVCDGIAATHAKGVIHRDIKPHNVLISSDGVCKVTDFGIARVDSDVPVTKTGSVMGTWGYMAPEQRNNAKSVDERSDVYALAATLYTLLTLRVPMDLFASDRDPQMMEGIPDVVLPVIRHATQYAREDRPASVQRFADELRSVLPSLAPLPPALPPLARPSAGVLPAPEPSNHGETLLPSDDDLASESVAVAKSTNARRANGTAPGRGAARALYAAGYGLSALMGATGLLLLLTAGSVWLWWPPPSTALATVSELPAAPKAADKATDSVAVPDAPPVVLPIGANEKTPAADNGKIATKLPAGGKGTASRRGPDAKPTPHDALDGSSSGTTSAPPLGTADDKPLPPKPPPEAKPVKPACFEVYPPRQVATGGAFRVSLCDDGKSKVTLWYRSVGGTWLQLDMPFVAGEYRAKVPPSDALAAGLEYYVVSGEQTFGSRAAPKSVGGTAQ